jgi:hypothetical protein
MGKKFSSAPQWAPIQWVLRCLSSGVKRPARETDPSYSAEVMNGGAIPLLPYTSSWRGAQLIKYRDNFTFLPYLFRLLTKYPGDN